MLKHKGKLAAAVVAGGLSAGLLLTGTFAWQSISQKAKNEVMAETNPGGRLHDDFNGKNKDIYVENFTDEMEGAPIFARVRLREYMEVGVGAGNPNDPDRDVQVVGNQAAQFDDSSTWAIHQYGAAATSTDHLAFHDYITWDEDGGSTVYMPTFNKNKDSLISDINGTLAGPDGYRPGDQLDTYDKYQDYQSYQLGDSVQGNAIYDADEDDNDDVGTDLIADTVNGGVTVDGGSDAVDGVNYTLAQETHEAKKTQDCTVITYAQWKDMPVEQQVGNYWVYDTDGWAYWAAPIMPDTATGLLLDGLSVAQTPGSEWYYAIDVEAQFASANGWGTKDDGDGFYDEANGGMQDSGAEILEQAAESLNNKITISLNNTVEDIATVDSFVAQPGDKARFSVTARINGAEKQLSMDELKDVKWDIVGSNMGTTAIQSPYTYSVVSYETKCDFSHNSALLTIDENVASGTVMTVVAEYRGMKDKVEVQVKELSYENLGDVIPGSLSTVTIDNIEWYVLVQDGNKVLLWADDSVGVSKYGEADTQHAANWEDSEVRNYLHTAVWDNLSILKQAAVSTELTTWDGRGYDTDTNWVKTTDSIFLLTEADLLGTAREFFPQSGVVINYKYRTLQVEDYTYQINGTGQVVAPDIEMKRYEADLNEGYVMDAGGVLRHSGGVGSERSIPLTAVHALGTYMIANTLWSYGVRPAMWVSLPTEAP